ncbi:type II toxin-antitoxin system VapC family toxin [Neorhizobium alkalisoli]|uniref:type II toxin-antitoxin system VapC family toxin n=1 Tax=Neorhizobium alkalisoli TaxID=528178 RepID=UPI000CF9AAAC|nr:type II toxin-antitoxin system VapC family toxin [Neorhizobium alkalisoli]
MVKALFDTNILVDYLNGIAEARDEWDRYSEKNISIITWMEVLIGAKPELVEATRDFLDSIHLISIDETVAARAVSLRQQFKMKLPDAIIWASADIHSMLLVTRNTKDFPANLPGIRIPYILRH